MRFAAFPALLFGVALALPVRFEITGCEEPAKVTARLWTVDAAKGTNELFLSGDAKGALVDPLDAGRSLFDLPAGDAHLEWFLGTRRGETNFRVAKEVPRLVLDLSSVQRIRGRKLDTLDATASEARRDPGRSSLGAAEARVLPGSGGDILRGMLNFPGVAPTPLFSSGLYIRGGDRFDVGYRVDGVPIGNPFHLLGFYSVFPNAGLDGVEFYPGAFPARFGDSQGALVDVRTKKNFDKSKLALDLDANLAIAGGSLSIPLGRTLQLSLSGRRTYYEAYLALVKSLKVPGLENVQKTLLAFDLVPFFFDVNAKIDWRPSPELGLSAFAIFSQDRLTLNTDRFPNPEEASNSLAFSLERDERWDVQGLTLDFEKGPLHLMGSLSRSYRSNGQNFQGISVFQGYQEDLNANLSGYLRLSGAANIGAGIEGTLETYPFQVAEFRASDQAVFRNPDLSLAQRLAAFADAKSRMIQITNLPRRLSLGAWVDSELTAGPFTFTPAVRFAFDELSKSPSFDPRLQISFRPSKAFELFAKGGLYSQKPLLLWAVSNFSTPDLRGQNSWHLATGARGEIGGFELRGEVYSKWLDSQVVANPTFDPVFPADEKNPRYLNEGAGRAVGLEILARRKLADRLFGWLAYALSSSVRDVFNPVDSAATLTGAAFGVNSGMDWKNLSRKTIPFSEDVTHNLTLLGSYEIIAKHLRLGTRLTFSTGKPYTAQILVRNASNQLALRDSEVINGERIPARLTWDLRLDVILSLGKSVDLSFYVDLWNLQDLFYKNVMFLSYPKSGWTEDRLGKSPPATPIYDLPIIPLLGLSLTF